MILYEFRCKDCGRHEDLPSRTPPFSCSCGGRLVRVFAVNTRRTTTFQAHYNHSVGRYVRSDAEFRSALSELSDHASRTTGVTHSYAPIDPRDMVYEGKALGATSEGMDVTRRVHEESHTVTNAEALNAIPE